MSIKRKYYFQTKLLDSHSFQIKLRQSHIIMSHPEFDPLFEQSKEKI